MVNVENGMATYYKFIPGWNNVPIMDRLAGKFGVPVSLENNIRSMAMAELWLGQGRGLRNFLCLGVRTGIGLSVVINGELYRGGHGCAGEIGLWPASKILSGSEPDGRQPLEKEASLSAILIAAEKATGRRMDAAALRAAVEVGDRGVQNVLKQAAAVHGEAIRQLHAFVDAERIIIVGPLAELGSTFLAPFTAAVGTQFEGGAPVIVNSSFGQFGGALGAAALALHRWRPDR
jgi:predicted NBD/HSP70 family sugar kinase